jgi:hypothetical protein
LRDPDFNLSTTPYIVPLAVHFTIDCRVEPDAWLSI